MSLEVRRAGSRFVTLEAGRETRHSFSFGPHYDPANLGFGLLVSHNDDRLAPGAGYPEHPHQEIEVVTWVLTGALAHRDSTGGAGVLRPGQVQVMSAGTGVVHSEYAEPGTGPTRFVQTWVRPAAWGEAPAYASADVSPGAGWTAVVGGDGLPVRAPGATLWITDASAGDQLVVPEVPHAHLFVATGAARLGEVELAEGDAVRMSDRGGDLTVTAPGQLMLWTFGP
ncbi:pirin family protein [Nocardioides jiangxiensis]|uniref:Pirin family protein n=1 Tax=Nocardioides jiangxiensis TaxID=3064524 RepID=A0ABT9AZW0_9ACTN|nr:pirin-like bicupin family protein [Nocardioides sp. WY-20]MDO7868089.1 pirin family protein [Nocardioides sp. WY-20]